MPPKHVRRLELHCLHCRNAYDRKSTLRSHIYHSHTDELPKCVICNLKEENQFVFNRHMIEQTALRLNRKAFDKTTKEKDLEELEWTVCRSCKGLLQKINYKEKAAEIADGTSERLGMHSPDENPQNLQHDNTQALQNPSDHLSQEKSHQVLQNSDENQQISTKPRDCTNENPQIPVDNQNPDNLKCPPDKNTLFKVPFRHHDKNKPLSEDPWYKPWLLPDETKPLSPDPWFPDGKNPWVLEDASDHQDEDKSLCQDPQVLLYGNRQLHQDEEVPLEVDQGFSQNPGLLKEENTSILNPPISEDQEVIHNDNSLGIQDVGMKPTYPQLHNEELLDCSQNLPAQQNTSLYPRILPLKNLKTQLYPLYRPAMTPGISLNPMLRSPFNPRICLNPLYCSHLNPLYRFRLEPPYSGENRSSNYNGNLQGLFRTSDRQHENDWICPNCNEKLKYWSETSLILFHEEFCTQ